MSSRICDFLGTVKPVWVILFFGTVILSVAGGQAYTSYLAGVHGIVDQGGQVLGRDFIGSWTAVLFLKAGDIGAIYSPSAYTAKLYELSGIHPQPWVYPPQYLLLLWPFTFISQYRIAYAVWSAINIAAFAIAMFWRSSLTFTWRWIALVAPSVLISSFLGQSGLLTAALIIGGFRLLVARPWLAGVLFGLLTFKPQLGILIPFILLALRQYKAIAGAACTLAVLVLASGVLFGWQSWEGFFANVWHMQSQVLHLLSSEMVSVFAATQVMGLPLSVGRCIQTSISITLTLAVYDKLRQMRQKHWTDWLRLALPAAYLVTPYVFVYDLCALSAAWVFWLREQGEKKVSVPGSLVWLAFWYIPFFSASLNKSGAHEFPFIPFLMLLAFVIAWRETKADA